MDKFLNKDRQHAAAGFIAGMIAVGWLFGPKTVAVVATLVGAAVIADKT